MQGQDLWEEHGEFEKIVHLNKRHQIVWKLLNSECVMAFHLGLYQLQS
jgi:hypothetical protein